jgi:hypothetical protein
MRLFLFGASVFYLLGLKLTSHIEIKSPLSAKPAIIELKTFPETKQNVQPLELKPELAKKDTAISAVTKSVHPSAPSVKAQRNNTFPRS